MKRASFILACAATGVWGCDTYPATLVNNLPIGAGGADAGVDSGPPIEPGYEECGPRITVPGPPNPEDIINTDLEGPPCISAVRSIDFGDEEVNPGVPAEKYLDYGLDVDHFCTTIPKDTATLACKLEPTYGTGAKDGPGGVDNVFGGFINIARIVIEDINSVNFSESMEKGQVTLVSKVTRYNGEPNDDQVRVDVFIAAPFDSFNGADAGTLTPAWNGEDEWPINADSVNDPTASDPLANPKVSDPYAYVTGNKLVASFASLTFPLQFHYPFQVNTQNWESDPTTRLNIEVLQANLVCDMAMADTGCRFNPTNCTLAGRVVANSVLHQFAQFAQKLAPATPVERTAPWAPMCTDSRSYPTFKSGVCAHVDLVPGVAGPTDVCNTLSFGLKWEGSPALIGNVTPVDLPVSMCPTELDPATDSCENLMFYEAMTTSL